MSSYISFRDMCVGCYNCVSYCPTSAIEIINTSWSAGTSTEYNNYDPSVDDGLCIECDICAYDCPTNNILIQGFSPHNGSGDGGSSSEGSGDNSSNNEDSLKPPCEVLNNMSKAGSKFRLYFDQLKGLTGASIEHGYVNYNGNEIEDASLRNLFYLMNSVGDGESVSSTMLNNVNAFGYIHTHRDQELIASIHSLADIHAYILMVNRRFKNGYSYDNTYGIVIGGQGTYSINITDITKFNIANITRDQFDEFWVIFSNDYEKEWENVTNDTISIENFMINLLGKYYDQLGMSLFNLDSKNNNWSKVVKGNNNKPEYEKEC